MSDFGSLEGSRQHLRRSRRHPKSDIRNPTSSLELYPPKYRSIHPEPRLVPRNKSKMSSRLWRDQRQMRVGFEGRMPKDIEGHERIVLRLDQKCWYENPIEELVRGLCRVIMLRAVKSKGRRSDLVVDYKEGAHAPKIGLGVAARGDQPLAHAAQEAALVVTVVDPAHTLDAGRQIDRRGCGADPGDEAAGALA